MQFKTDLAIKWKLVNWFATGTDWFLYDCNIALVWVQLQILPDFYNLILSISQIITNFVIFAISLPWLFLSQKNTQKH